MARPVADMAPWPARRSSSPTESCFAYRKGIVERRSPADGKPLATLNIEQPLATGPVTSCNTWSPPRPTALFSSVDKP